MTAEYLAKWNAIIIAGLALGLVLYPAFGLAVVGVETTSFQLYAFARTFGAFCLVLAALLWATRAWLGSALGQPARRILAAAYGLGAIVLLAQQIAIWNNRPGLGICILFATWSLSYWRVDATEPASVLPAPPA